MTFFNQIFKLLVDKLEFLSKILYKITLSVHTTWEKSGNKILFF